MTFNLDFLSNLDETINSTIGYNNQNMSRYQAQKQIINGYSGPQSANCSGGTIIGKINEKYGYANNELNMIDVSAKEVLVLLNNKPLFKTKKLFWELESTDSFYAELENAMLLFKLDLLFEGETT